ncbi:hypothetical protein [Desulfurobacterium atlanticum]|uniref:Uncharacterized protein n=1 Tax=Desulfurobacterium atlanticum TaxID=240169 RepID=A0A239A9X7_9BACT|nr:hypothetical protein [Desulfurobacterium atlanticum]SNR91683.1 hypothetical protein SAMN06265340_11623 [Desulfurobacterium atlanticum]
MGHTHDPVVEEKMQKIKYFKDWISAFQLLVALSALIITCIYCLGNIWHLYMIFFGGGH